MTSEKDAVARAIAAMSVADADKEEIERRREMGLPTKASQNPDIPACDACGKEFSANLICGACQSAFYCTKECQKNAWKYGGHKQECPDRKEQCKRDAQRVVKALSRRSFEDCQELEGEGFLDCLNGAGAYKAAVDEGLHDALCGLFSDDADEIMKLFQSDGCTVDGEEHVWAATRTVTCSLFRGQRAEGRAVKNRSFGCFDGQRIKAYVNSSSDAFDLWLDASLETMRLPFDDIIWSRRGPYGNGQHTYAHRAARDTIAGWILVAMNKRTSKAVLMPTVVVGGGDDEGGDDDVTTGTTTAAQAAAAKARSQSIADRLRKFLHDTSGKDERDPNGTVTGMVCQTVAMLAYRVREFEIDLDFAAQLNMKGMRKNMYEQIAVPLGEATIVKGATLTNAEAKEAMSKAAAQPKKKQGKQSGRGKNRR
jgi:hypothetical protein